VGEGYYGIAPEGPFTSMLCQDGRGHEFSVAGLASLEYEIVCSQAGQEVWSTSLTRRRGRAEADLPQPMARALLFDDEVASRGPEVAQSLAPYGVDVLAVEAEFALRRIDEFPADLPLFLIGVGRASAATLETALRLKAPAAVALFSGGGLRFDALKPPDGEGEGELAHIGLDHASLRPKAEGILITRKLYADAVADKANRERGRIEVERIACPIFMFSGLDDQIWPASAFSELVAQRRKIRGCRYPTYHKTFEGVGHDLGPTLGPPTLPTTERTVSHPETGFRLLLGGKPGRQARARRECWDILIRILSGDAPE
jgi:hypothetical protein